MSHIEIFNETDEKLKKESKEIKNILKKACEKEKLDNVEFNVILVSLSYIQALNKLYRRLDKPTDVLTFALEDDKTMISPIDKRILGDIYICVDKARLQALTYGHSFLREICFLSIHGFYHLLGYDHQTKAEEKVMFALQEEVLTDYGIQR